MKLFQAPLLFDLDDIWPPRYIYMSLTTILIWPSRVIIPPKTFWHQRLFGAITTCWAWSLGGHSSWSDIWPPSACVRFGPGKKWERRYLCSLHIKRERLLMVNEKIGTFSLPSFHQPREVHLSPRSFCAPNSWTTGAAAFYALARFSSSYNCTTLRKLSPSRAVPLISFRTFSTSLLFSAASKSRRFFWKQ